jgi:hypothetical protein
MGRAQSWIDDTIRVLGSMIGIVAIIAAIIVIVPALLLFLLHSLILDWQGKIKDPGNPFRDEWTRWETRKHGPP